MTEGEGETKTVNVRVCPYVHPCICMFVRAHVCLYVCFKGRLCKPVCNDPVEKKMVIRRKRWEIREQRPLGEER